MQRHLLPTEIDLLLDGETGFGVAPLHAHVDECESCRARLADARVVVDQLERLPHLLPHHGFADRVMAQVQVVEPLHVAAMTTAQRLVPRSTPLRAAAAVLAIGSAVGISAASVWLTYRADLAVYGGGVIARDLREALSAGIGRAIGGALGTSGIEALWGGPSAWAAGAIVLSLGVAAATFGFRRLAAAARSTRS